MEGLLLQVGSFGRDDMDGSSVGVCTGGVSALSGCCGGVSVGGLRAFAFAALRALRASFSPCSDHPGGGPGSSRDKGSQFLSQDRGFGSTYFSYPPRRTCLSGVIFGP